MANIEKYVIGGVLLRVLLYLFGLYTNSGS